MSTPMVQFAAVQVIRAARGVLDDFLQHPKIGPVLAEKNKCGGYLCVGERGYGIYAVTMLGSHPKEKASTFSVALAKVQYLLDNPSAIMSREGRNPERGLWGGGLAVPIPTLNTTEPLLSFSGFPEHVDELFVMALAARMNLLSRRTAVELLTKFPNDYAKPEEDNLVFL